MQLNIINSLGKITVVTPGTLVQLTTDTTIRATFVVFNTPSGNLYIGTSNLSRATGAGILAKMTSSSQPLVLQTGYPDTIRLSDIYFDADAANTTIIVGYFAPSPERLS